MSDNHDPEEEVTGGSNEPGPADAAESELAGDTSSEAMSDLFLSPDDSEHEEVEEQFDPPAPAPASDGEVRALREQLETVTAERDDFKNRMMRVAADLENFRKRTMREKEDLRKYGIDRVVLELLPVVDNLERALDHADKTEDTATIVDGVRMVYRQFLSALEKHGVKGFVSAGTKFDPQKHEAIQQVDTTEHPTGSILEEFQKGYYLHDRLIRPALVVVARNTGGAPAASDEPLLETEEPGQEEAPESPLAEETSSSGESSDGGEESTIN